VREWSEARRTYDHAILFSKRADVPAVTAVIMSGLNANGCVAGAPDGAVCMRR